MIIIIIYSYYIIFKKRSEDLSKLYFSNNEIVLTSAINIIEIWDKTLYEKVINDPGLDFANLSESVMGNQSEDVS